MVNDSNISYQCLRHAQTTMKVTIPVKSTISSAISAANAGSKASGAVDINIKYINTRYFTRINYICNFIDYTYILKYVSPTLKLYSSLYFIYFISVYLLYCFW